MKPYKFTDWSDVAAIIVFAILIILFYGTPDLMDVILFNLSGGAVPLPKP